VKKASRLPEFEYQPTEDEDSLPGGLTAADSFRDIEQRVMSAFHNKFANIESELRNLKQPEGKLVGGTLDP